MKKPEIEHLLGSDLIATIECSSGHRLEVGLDELEEALYHDACPEDECGTSISAVTPEELSVACASCSWGESGNWKDIAPHFSMDCPECGGRTPSIYGSYSHLIKVYQERTRLVGAARFDRKGRPDVSTLLIHFCEREDLVAILSEQVIRSSTTGYYKVPAICLTEAPLAAADGLRERFGQYGLAFHRDRILQEGGQPVLQVTEDRLMEQKRHGDFCEGLKPFVNLIRLTGPNPFDFVHEREWRVPHDIDLRQVQPVGLILPEGSHPSRIFNGPDGKTLLGSVFEYGKLVAYDPWG